MARRRLRDAGRAGMAVAAGPWSYRLFRLWLLLSRARGAANCDRGGAQFRSTALHHRSFRLVPRRTGGSAPLGAAVVIGFLGVVTIVRPGTDLFDWAALLPITSSLLYAVAMILTRRIGGHETAPAMSTWGNLVFLVGALALSAAFGSGAYQGESHRSLAFLMRGWAQPSLVDFVLMSSCGVIAAVALTLLTQAYRVAEANVVAPFEYTALIWSVLNGWIFWREWPDAVGWLGILIIVGAGTYVFYREQVKSEAGQARAVSARPNSP